MSDGLRLYEEIQRQGYRGGRSTVLGYFTQLRKAQGLASRTRTVQPALPVTDPTVQCIMPRQATWLTLRWPKDVTEDEQLLLTRLHHAHPALAQAIALTQDFAQLLRARQPARLEAWVQQASPCPGVTEGYINRLKMLKRHMFGRARLDLLSRRFVLAPQQGRPRLQADQSLLRPLKEPRRHSPWAVQRGGS